MPSAAAQRAPEPKKAAPAPKKTVQDQERPEGVMQKLRALPQGAGIAIMAALLVAALFVGNARALDRVSPGPFLGYGEVASIVEDRAAQAENALNVVARALPEIEAEGGSRAQEAAESVREALSALRDADGAREVSRADQALTAAISELTDAAALSGEDAQSLSRALDNFAEQGSFLRQEARAYNEKADEAAALYKRLPTRFALEAPERYEGI